MAVLGNVEYFGGFVDEGRFGGGGGRGDLLQNVGSKERVYEGVFSRNTSVTKVPKPPQLANPPVSQGETTT